MSSSTPCRTMECASAPAKVTLTITGNPPPMPSPIPQRRRSRSRHRRVNDSDPNGSLAPATVTVTSGPAHGTTSVNTATGAVTYTPASGYAGSDEFFYTVADNEGAVSQPAKVTVTITNPPPSAVADTTSTPFDTAVIIGVLGNDSDPNGSLAPATVTVTTGPAHGSTSVNTTTGAITYTPATNYTGTGRVLLQRNGQLGRSSLPTKATVTITGNPPPTAVADTASTIRTPPCDDQRAEQRLRSERHARSAGDRRP